MTTTTKTCTLSVEEANDIQKMWMALESTAPTKMKNFVFKKMEKLPSAYLSVSSDECSAQAMIHGSPVCATMEVRDCLKFWHTHLDKHLAWSSAGEWISLPFLQIRLERYAQEVKS